MGMLTPSGVRGYVFRGIFFFLGIVFFKLKFIVQVNSRKENFHGIILVIRIRSFIMYLQVDLEI